MEIYRKLKNSSKLKILAFWKKKTLLIIPKAELLGREGIQNLSASYLLPEISGLVCFFLGGGQNFIVELLSKPIATNVVWFQCLVMNDRLIDFLPKYRF